MDRGNGAAEVTAASSHAVMAAEIADLRQDFADLKAATWALIGAAKQAAPFLPGIPRAALLEEIVRAENSLMVPRSAR